jgi:putative lipoic acid-binding regulatory protein
MALNRKSELKQLLDQQHQWPEAFLFKFIYKNDPSTENQLRALFSEDSEIAIKQSKKNSFNSMSVNTIMKSAKEVLDVYAKVGKMEGVISL